MASTGPIPQVTDVIGSATLQLFLEFLNTYSTASHSRESSERTGSTSASVNPLHYVDQAQRMVDLDTTTLYVDFTHLALFSIQLADSIVEHFYRVEPFLCQAVFTFMKTHFPEHAVVNSEEKKFYVSIYNLPEPLSIRDLRTANIGKCLSLHGTVTRTSQSRPELVVGAFRCVDCDAIVRNVKQQFKFTEPVVCVSSGCNNRKKFVVDSVESQFVDWQQLRLQESSNDIPAGSMPRSLTVILRHELVEVAKPGDKVAISGCLIVVPDVNMLSRGASPAGVQERGRQEEGEGLRGLKELGVRDLTYKLCFLASNVTVMDAGGAVSMPRGLTLATGDVNDPLMEFTLDQRRVILAMKHDPQCVPKILRSLAPTIYGHEMIKKGVLLMLLGGVNKVTKDKTHLRGDINVCIVGDPSTSKSQFLKYVCTFTPRAVYTSGKASSAAGLTAAVTRDSDTGEYTIEAGALMLADNGVCCIDEFDKMDPKDQSAIHEAMEQQTISIAKAGIQATLNARTSILAAANPISGRYDRSKTLRSNVDITPPIMSRFDLFFIVVDEGNVQTDKFLGKHILRRHRSNNARSAGDNDDDEAARPAPAAQTTPYTLDDLQTYVRFARTLNPVMSEEAKHVLTDKYEELRGGDSLGGGSAAYRITVRQLESLVRLSEALARLHLEEVVQAAHVHEAAELLKQSVMTVRPHDITLEADEDISEAADADESMVDAPVDAPAEEEKVNEEEEEEEEEETEVRRSKRRRGNDGDAVDAPAEVKSKKDKKDKKEKKEKKEKQQFTLSFADLRRYTLMTVLHLRSLEARGESELSRQGLIDWLVSEDHEVATAADNTVVVRKAKLLGLVVKHMIERDQTLMVTATGGVAVNPNYSVEDDAAVTARTLRNRDPVPVVAQAPVVASEPTEEPDDPSSSVDAILNARNVSQEE